jgi:hypothetical protein
MVKPVQYGRVQRMSYSKIDEILDIPDLLEIQKSSYQWFLDEGLMEVLNEVSPISDFSGDIELSFIGFDFDIENPTYSIEECKERDANYAAKMNMKVRLHDRKMDVMKEEDVYVGEFPIMTDTGSFIINGAERVIISQLVRSPGTYFDVMLDKNDIELYTAQVIPNRGAWIEFESDAKRLLWVRVDRQRKFHLTILLRALGIGTDEEIIDVLGEEESLLLTMQKDGCKTSDEGLQEMFRKLRSGEVYTREGAQALLHNNFFNPNRYDLAKVGVYKLNKKLAIADRLAGHVAAVDIIADDGEVLVLSDEIITREAADAIQQAGVNSVDVYPIHRRGDTVTRFDHCLRIVGNERVNARTFLERYIKADVLDPIDFEELGITESVYTPVLREIVEEVLEATEQEDKLRKLLKLRINELIPRHLTLHDILATMSYYIGLEYGVGRRDDIDHLGNRRIRSVGELLQNQMRIGFSRMERVVRERMQTIPDILTTTPKNIVNTRPISAAIKEFFGSSQLSQFMDQPNPLAEMTHKRRLSALAQQILTEASLLTLQQVGERLQRSVTGTGNWSPASTVVDQGIDGFLQHSLFVADNNVRSPKLQKFIQTIVPVDHATIQIVQIRCRKTSAVKLDHGTQFRRQDGQNIEHHPTRFVTGISECLNDFKALDDTRLALTARAGLKLLTEPLGEAFNVDFREQIANRFRSHLGDERIATEFLNSFAVIALVDDLHFGERCLSRVNHDICREINDLLKIARRHVEEKSHTARDTAVIPNMCHGRGKAYMSHPLATNLRQRHFYAALIADNTAVTLCLVFATETFPISRRSENLLAEQSIRFRFKCSIVNCFRFLHFAFRPSENFFRRSEADAECFKISHFRHCAASFSYASSSSSSNSSNLSVSSSSDTPPS